MGPRTTTNLLAAALLVSLAACGHPAPDPDDVLWRPGASLIDHAEDGRVASLPACSLPPAVARAASGPLVVEYGADDWLPGRPVTADVLARLREVRGVEGLGDAARRFHLTDPVRLDLPRGDLALTADGVALVQFRERLDGGTDANLVFVDAAGDFVLWFTPSNGRVALLAEAAPASFVVSYTGDDGGQLAAWEWSGEATAADGAFPVVSTDPGDLPTATSLVRRVTLDDTTRDALLVAAPGAVGFDVDVRDVASLAVSVGMVDHAFEVVDGRVLRTPGRSDGARVSVVLERGVERTELWAGEVAPGAAWTDVEVPLGGALDDPRCTLWLVSDPGDDAAFDYVAWGGLRARGRERVRPERPNIVLVVLDTLRDDTLGGRRPPTTPRLDAWAERHDATRYVCTRTPAPWTLPATVSMLSGLDPLQHDVRRSTDRMGAALPHVAEQLADAGYETFARTGAGYLSASFGIDRGFETFVEQGDHDELPDWSDAEAWVAGRRSDAPFFVLLHTYHVHAVYPYDPRFEDDADPYDGPLAGRDVDYEQVIAPFNAGTLSLDDADEAYVRRMYDAGAARTDALVADTLAAIAEAAPLDDTAVFVTSDHGEELFEHGAIGHGHSLHGELVAVPLIVRWPSRDGVPPRAAVSSRRTSLLDLAPTLLDLAGAPLPDVVVGRSLLDDVPSDRPLFASLEAQRRLGDGDFTLLVGARGRATLYDADDDPSGSRNLAPRQPERVARMRRALEAYESSLVAVDGAGGQAVLDADAVEALRAMGYLEDG